MLINYQETTQDDQSGRYNYFKTYHVDKLDYENTEVLFTSFQVVCSSVLHWRGLLSRVLAFC